jgi:hypothetical protein
MNGGQFLPETLDTLSSGRISINDPVPTGELQGSFDYTLVLKNFTYSGTVSFSAVPCFAGPPIPPPSCHFASGSCDTKGDCCHGLTCNNHLCCAAAGIPASGNDFMTCCSKMAYQIENDVICCAPKGSSCTFDQDCCSQGGPGHGFCSTFTCQ